MLGGVNSGYQHGSMDSINSINSYNSNTLSFDSDLSVGKLLSNATSGQYIMTDHPSHHQAVFRAGP